MKNLLILATMLLTFGFAKAQSKIYNSKGAGYSSNIVGYYEGGGASAAAAAMLLLF